MLSSDLLGGGVIVHLEVATPFKMEYGFVRRNKIRTPQCELLVKAKSPRFLESRHFDRGNNEYRSLTGVFW